MVALGFEVLLGSLTFTGSLMAFGKLQDLLPSGRSSTGARTSSTCSSSAAAVAIAAYLTVNPGTAGPVPGLRSCSAWCSASC